MKKVEVKKVEVKKVLNTRSDDPDLKISNLGKKKKREVEDKTSTSKMACCSCGDQWSEINR